MYKYYFACNSCDGCFCSCVVTFFIKLCSDDTFICVMQCQQFVIIFCGNMKMCLWLFRDDAPLLHSLRFPGDDGDDYYLD